MQRILPQNALLFRPIQQRAALAAYRRTAHIRCESSKSTPAKDSPSALENLKGPSASPPSPSIRKGPLRAEEDEPKESTFRTWALAANKVATFAIIPMTLLYAVFFADFGEHEHAFMPVRIISYFHVTREAEFATNKARRWMLRQKAAFYTLTPAEQELIKPRDMVKVIRHRDLQKQDPPLEDSPSSSTA
ncbi:hypothetical protein BXZ70DRAFT_1011720 [Cristinia sonorae]|uniref:Uncharacterized protein n=1 Tax=Cristinia sonorae TaxID=1940300 RepID=A0A8K0UGL7_9AGAR|nr:hypothetical protein BXZ70DRAFT_1011720 [Cristinia sonorae]